MLQESNLSPHSPSAPTSPAPRIEVWAPRPGLVDFRNRMVPGWFLWNNILQWIGLRENPNRKPSIFPFFLWGFPVFFFPLNQCIEYYMGVVV